MTSQEKNKFYVTTPIYYVTAKPHLGSLYSTLLADVAARWHKLKGEKTFFLTGTDEHGQKVAQAAQAAGKDPQAFVDSFVDAFKNLWHTYNIQYDSFIRTTDPDHIKAVQLWIETVQKKGDIYKSLYSGWYCTPCEAYVAEAADQKEAPLCSSCNRQTNFVSEECYFFRLSAYQDRLLKFYQENSRFIIPKERLNEVLRFVESGLRDLSISRTTISWGIPFPGDSKHVVYVWADALTNYLSGIGYGNEQKKDEFSYWWPADMQILGKDIVRFHAVYWPAFLMAADLPLPKKLLVHGWIKVGAEKMSKSFGNVIDPEFLSTQYHVDTIRYYLMRHMAITHDTEYSIKDLEQRITTDLANDLGNLFNRMITLAFKYNLSIIKPQKVWSESALELRDQLLITLQEYEKFMDEGMFHLALSRLWKFINHVNSYFHAQEPWQLAKTDEAQFAEVISAVCHCLYTIAFAVWPVMPSKMEALLNGLGTILELDRNHLQELEHNSWDRIFNLCMIPPLFEIPAEKADEKQAEVIEPECISIEDVKKIQLRVGTIEACEHIAKSDKLYKLRVLFGDRGARQILAGIKPFFKQEDLIGKQAIFVANLKPRIMMGLESQGMMLLVKNEKGSLEYIEPHHKVPDGTLLQ